MSWLGCWSSIWIVQQGGVIFCKNLRCVGVGGETSPPTHRDKAAMNGAQIRLSGMDRWVEGSVSGPPAENNQMFGDGTSNGGSGWRQ